MIASFLSALQFLTVIPIKLKEANEQRMADSMVYFPFIGLLLGLFLIGVNALLSFLNFPSLAMNVITVITLIFITGGLHLDGLSDTADAFLSGRPGEQMLEIMRDSRTGVMGVLSLISVILLKIILLFSISGSLESSALILMCSLSRWSAVAAVFFFPYARQQGKAEAFIKGMNLKIFILSAVATVLCASIAWQIRGLIVLLIVTGFSYALGKFSVKKIGGITGDTLGATIELTEIITLLAIFILGNIQY
ncbi:MAG: adenosylcobinamide-GDP ribazoletransferase [Candidatus Omnitrophica bacterium]|nr:adenosylcobinamide-GDP ribazoletransferase [Candidatus Omnitrophota bacterium]